jgi:uncharacterized membrane protein
MEYGKGAVPGVAGVAVLPFTGSNNVLLILAASLIVLGTIIFVVSIVLARKNRQTNTN